MAELHLILTGGTLSAVRNAEGLLVPSTDTVQVLAASLGYHDIVKPYTIDSIDFDICVHYPILRDGIIAALKNNLTPVICGGTDTLSWYSSLIAQDLLRRGYLRHGSGQKIIFLSAMRTLQDAPELVANILRAGLIVAADIRFEGGFALSAKSLTDTTLDIHDVTNQLDKISAELLNAFRSHAPVAYVKYGEILWNQNYQQPSIPVVRRENHYARIAPSLLRGQNLQALLTYLECIRLNATSFDGALIESLPLNLDSAALKAAITPLINAEKYITFCNPVRYSNELECMLPVTDETEWNNKTHSLAKILDSRYVQFITDLPKDAYIRMMLDTPTNAQSAPAHDATYNGVRQKFMGIRYIPHHKIMTALLTDAAHAAENILFSSLPGGVMPSAILPVLEQHAVNTRFWSMFDYEGNRYVDFDGRTFVESQKNTYAAGQDTTKLVRPYYH
ncbi:MAG: asparaginase domain-containing protein [Alphaproteobacteria bacterium]